MGKYYNNKVRHFRGTFLLMSNLETERWTGLNIRLESIFHPSAWAVGNADQFRMTGSGATAKWIADILNLKVRILLFLKIRSIALCSSLIYAGPACLNGRMRELARKMYTNMKSQTRVYVVGKHFTCALWFHSTNRNNRAGSCCCFQLFHIGAHRPWSIYRTTPAVHIRKTTKNLQFFEREKKKKKLLNDVSKPLALNRISLLPEKSVTSNVPYEALLLFLKNV